MKLRKNKAFNPLKRPAQTYLLCLCASGAYADSSYTLRGQLDLRSEIYDTSGSRDTLFYNDEGLQSYGELNLDFNQNYSAYKFLRTNVGVLLNDSSFRGENGFELERANLTFTDGDSSTPYRSSNGDVLAYFSQRTLQTSLIGTQLEFQPQWSGGQGSLQFLTGFANTDYRALEDDNWFTGISWLSGIGEDGSYSINLVHNRQNGDLEKADQSVLSAAAAYSFLVGSHTLDSEVELAYFNGDISDSGVISSESDTGIFVELNGRDSESEFKPNYQLRYQKYGEEYRPAGSSIVSDRESVEGRFSFVPWRTINVHNRFQRFEDNVDSGNKLTTDVVGLGVTGSYQVFERTLSVNFDTFVNDAENEQDTTDTTSRSTRLDLSMPVTDQVTATLGYQTSKTEDNNANTETENDLVNAGLTLPVNHWGWTGSISPTLSFNDSDTNDQVNGALNLNARKNNHDLSLSLRSLLQVQDAAATPDSRFRSSALRYHYRLNEHRFGFEYDSQYRNTSTDDASEGYRIGLTYQLNFDYSPTGTTASTQQQVAISPIVSFNPVMLGDTTTVAKKQLEDKGLSSRQVGSYLVSDVSLFDFTDARQLLVSGNPNGRIDSTGVIVFPSNNDIERVLTDMLSEVTENLGSPSIIVEKGEFSSDLVANLQNDSFQRLYGWAAPDGSYVYLGIPFRLDGQVRIELIAGDSGEPLRSGGLWGFQGLTQ